MRRQTQWPLLTLLILFSLSLLARVLNFCIQTYIDPKKNLNRVLDQARTFGGSKLCVVKQIWSKKKFGTKIWGGGQKCQGQIFVGFQSGTECMRYWKARTPFGIHDTLYLS